jgi:voltage-gated potassium channel Kch
MASKTAASIPAWVIDPRRGAREMPTKNGAQSKADQSESDPQARVPLTTRLLLRQSLTARRAAAIIAGFTVLITVGGGILERVLDPKEYPTIGRGLWFALQTVTTVGYGDVTPSRTVGRFIATVLMLTAIGFLAVITASVTASLVESGRQRVAASSRADVDKRLDEVNARLARIEAALSPARSGGTSDGIS